MFAYLHNARGGGMTLSLCNSPSTGADFANAEKIKVSGKREANAICKARGAMPMNW